MGGKGFKISMINQDRLIFLFIFIVIAIPMIVPLGLPIPVSRTTRDFYDTLDSIPDESVVLWCTSIGFSIWYNTGPGEISAFEHIFRLVRARNVKFIVFAESAEAAAIVRRIIDEHIDTSGLVYGEDYVDLGWIPGMEAAISGVVTDLRGTVDTDYEGTPIDELPLLSGINSGDDIDVFGFSSGSMIDRFMRQWAQFNKPILLNMIAIGVPLVMPYVEKGMVTAYINGQRGGAEYEQLLNNPGMGASFIDAQSMIHLYIIFIIIVVSIWSFWRRDVA
jgi:hypothetical protein